MRHPAQKKRPTINDVAQLSGLSIATVSRYMNGTVFVSEENAARIQAAIESLNYIPHSAAQILAGQRTRTLGLLLPQISGDFFTPILRGVETCTSAEGYSLLVHSTEFAMQRKGPFKRVLGEHNTDGLIIFTHSVDDRELVRLKATGLPVVLIFQEPPGGLDFAHVVIENKSGVHALVQHLYHEHGRRKMIHLRGTENHSDAIARQEGYRQALEELGLPYQPDMVLSGDFDSSAAYASIREAIARRADFDAIVAADDESAAGALRALREAGVDVPGRVSVVGFDDTSLASHLVPPLTTVHSPIEQAGFEAARQLIHIVRGEAADHRTILSTELVLRRSCGCEYDD